MIKSCLFDKNRNCDIALDYEILQHTLTEAAELAHSNWIEIEYQYNRILQLENLLKENGIAIPPEE